MLKSSSLQGPLIARVTPKGRRYIKKTQIVMVSSAFQKRGQLPRFMLVSDLDWTMVRLIYLNVSANSVFPPSLQ